MRVAICIPSGDMLHTDFAISLANMVLYTKEKTKIDIAIISTRSSIIQKGRCDMIEAALQLKPDYILMLDSDMGFPPDTLLTLLESNCKIVGCDYPTRRRPLTPTARDLNFETHDYTHSVRNNLFGVKEVGYLGAGVMLIKAEVFNKMEKPYFNVEYVKEKNIFNGEDYYFCKTARVLGYKIYCHFDLSYKIKHYGITGVSV